MPSSRHMPRIDERGVGRRHVRRRRHPRQARLLQRHVARPTRGGADDEVEIEPALRGEEPRQLSGRHPVAHGDRVEADEGQVAGRLRRALDGAADRVGPVADDEAQPRAGARLHREQHRPDVGVVAAPDVRDVEDDRFQVREILAARLQALRGAAVERHDRESRRRVDRGADRLHVDRAAFQTVLGPEEPHEPRVRGPLERLPRRHALRGDARRVRDEADALAGHRPRLLEEHVDSESGFVHTGRES